MGIVVTVMNMKGGVGKTTVTVNLAGILSRYGVGGKSALNMLMIDYDPQFNLSQAYLEPKNYFALEKSRKTTLAVLMDDATVLNPYQIQVPENHTLPSVSSLRTSIYKQAGRLGRLDIVPSTLDLMYVALGQATTKTDPIEERFAKFIEETRSAYDLVLIDCHPAGSLFTKTSLTNSDHVLIPVMPQKYAVRGIGLMMEFITAKKAGNAGPEPIILFNATARKGVSVEETSIRSNPKYGRYCLPSTLKYFKAFGEPEKALRMAEHEAVQHHCLQQPPERRPRLPGEDRHMNSPRYNTFLRTLYGAVLASRLSVSDLKALSEELRHGRLPDELAYMIDRALEHLRGLGEGEPEDERMAEAEYLIRRGRVSKATLASIMGSLGVPPSSRKDSARDMLRHFMNEVPPSRVTKFMEVLRSQQAGDEFLAGIGETRK